MVRRSRWGVGLRLLLLLLLWSLVTRWRRYLSCLPTPLYHIFFKVPRLSLPSTLISIIVPVPIPNIAPISSFMLIPVLALVPDRAPVPVTIPSFLSLMPCSPLGTTWLGRRRVLRPKLLATCRRYLLSTEMMPRTKLQSLVFYSVCFLMWRIPELISPPSCVSVFVCVCSCVMAKPERGLRPSPACVGRLDRNSP